MGRLSAYKQPEIQLYRARSTKRAAEKATRFAAKHELIQRNVVTIFSHIQGRGRKSTDARQYEQSV